MHEVQIPFPIGSLIQGQYTVIDVLGENVSGGIYLVRDTGRRHTQNLYVLKEVVCSTRKGQNSFPFEKFLKRLNHPPLPRIHRVFWNDTHDRVYLLMEYLEGDTLEVLHQQLPDKQISFSQALTLLSPIVSAISYLHQQRPSLIHGNIKPSNIIMTKEGGSPVLVNFGGFGEYVSSAPTPHQSTSNFLAPEQYKGRTSVRSDIYALGATLYALLTGILPPSASERVAKLAQKEPDPLSPMEQLAPSVHPLVAEAVHRAMSINSHDRFSSVEQFWEALWQMILVNPIVDQEALLATSVAVEENKGQEEGSTSFAKLAWPASPQSESSTEMNTAPMEQPRPR